MSAEGSGHVWRHFPRDEELSVFVVALAIGDIVNDTHAHELFTSQRELALKVGLHRNSVNAAVQRMIELGWLVQIEDNTAVRKANKYRFVFDFSRPVAWATRKEREHWHSESASEPDDWHSEGDVLAPSVGQHWHSESAHNSNRTQLNIGGVSSERQEPEARDSEQKQEPDPQLQAEISGLAEAMRRGGIGAVKKVLASRGEEEQAS